jgi:peptidoglycan/LPS O-acetylase OafA/YrhL
MSRSARIPSLDGLRALSISLVIFAHLCGTTDWPFSQGTLSATRNLGALGVRVFFVISGFLICQQLIDESQAQGTVSLRRFWLRRSLRIFPPAFAFIGVMCTLNHTARFLEPGDLTAAVTYTMNYHRQHAWQLGHLWSLSVEEQFYLTWPLVALAGVTHMRFCALVTIILGPFMRLLVSQYYPGVLIPFDAIAAGCFLACVRPRLHASALNSWYTHFPINLSLGLACATISFYAVERPFQRLRRALEVRLIGAPASIRQVALS